MPLFLSPPPPEEGILFCWAYVCSFNCEVLQNVLWRWGWAWRTWIYIKLQLYRSLILASSNPVVTQLGSVLQGKSRQAHACLEHFKKIRTAEDTGLSAYSADVITCSHYFTWSHKNKVIPERWHPCEVFRLHTGNSNWTFRADAALWVWINESRSATLSIWSFKFLFGKREQGCILLLLSKLACAFYSCSHEVLNMPFSCRALHSNPLMNSHYACRRRD